VTTAAAHAKLNLALVVGPRRDDGLHEIATVIQRIDLADRVSVEPATTLEVRGFPEDTLVRAALEGLGAACPGAGGWAVMLEKEIPVASGLGGGSSDAATALRLANETLAEPLRESELHQLAARVGSDVPFFLAPGPKLATGTGAELSPLELPQGYVGLVLLPHGERKDSTRTVYEAFDERRGDVRFADRRAELLRALEQVAHPQDLAGLPRNDLVSSPLAAELERAGAFRADVTGAGPAVYGLFRDRAEAERAAERMGPFGAVWVTAPAW
jgi:4-diphosphocytidyl-2-C-methyl-D-erythritol kinase